MVTGSVGFLAHHIIENLLKNGYYVVGVDKRPIPNNHSIPNHFIQTDVRDIGFRDLMGIDVVIHLAWRTNIPDCQRHPVESTYDNIDMSVHLIEKAKEAGVKKLVFPSTASAYGLNPTPWKEDMKMVPIEPYSWQKLAIEEYCKMSELNCSIVRFFQVFGEFQRDDTALAAFMKAKREGKPVTLTKTTAQSTFRSGQRDFIYAGDVAEAVRVVLEKGEKGEVYNVASGKIHTMEEIADALEAEVEWIDKREYEVERHLGNVDKIKALGWEPSINVITWLKQYGNL